LRRATVAARALLVRAGFLLGRLLPLNRQVVLASSRATSGRGNLAWIAADLERRHPEVEVRHLASRVDRGVLGSIRHLAASVRAGFALARARVTVVDDYFLPMYVISPRRGTTRVQVWHAAGAFKKFGYSVADRTFGADEGMLRQVRIHANYSLALVSSASAIPHYAEAFGQPASIFSSRIGIPRTDLFFDPDLRAAAEARVRREHGLPGDRRVILYAPTFRGTSVARARDDRLLDLELMHRVLGEDHVVLLRLHPFIRRAAAVPPGLDGFVVDASADPDINELMLASDLLVSDYSSAIYEFALLGRPILFLAPDVEAYDAERSFYFDFRAEAPGPIFDTTEALAEHIRAGRFDVDRVRRFAAASFDVADGHATERLVDLVLMPALDGTEPVPARLDAALRPAGTPVPRAD
jgi:CDP-ribitol ribitolphosphotransferase